MYPVQAILVTLLKRQTGEYKKLKIEIPMLDCLLSWTMARMEYSLALNKPYPRGRRHVNLAPYSTFETADSFIVIAVSSNKLWQGFCKAIQ
jgi:crotonobetainyl-CoA:carnitine CoA-transferase CaiB-like acyl-CoA transferase